MNVVEMNRYIRESNLIEGIRDPQEVAQSLGAWNELKKHTGPLTHGIICRVQGIITHNQGDLHPIHKGYYRYMGKTNVWVGTRMAPAWTMVQGLMDNWLMDYGDPAKDFDPLEAHIRFEHNHPFADGNGRTGRMLLWWHQTRKNIEPTLYTAAERHVTYYPLFEG